MLILDSNYVVCGISVRKATLKRNSIKSKIQTILRPSPFQPERITLMTTSAVTPAPPTRRAGYSKLILWTLMALGLLSVLIFTEYPYFVHPNPNRDRVFGEKLAFLPHALAGLIALAIGPFQFSTRLRQRNLALHRILGKTYVIAVILSALTSLIISHHLDKVDQPETYIFWETVAQASLWLITTIAAFITARNRHIATHRQWMIRSYAITFVFVTSRIPTPIPAVQHMSDAGFTIFLFMLLIASVIAPDIYFSWKELTRPRA